MLSWCESKAQIGLYFFVGHGDYRTGDKLSLSQLNSRFGGQSQYKLAVEEWMIYATAHLHFDGSLAVRPADRLW